jgi:hypothetical protein
MCALLRADLFLHDGECTKGCRVIDRERVRRGQRSYGRVGEEHADLTNKECVAGMPLVWGAGNCLRPLKEKICERGK